MGKIEINEELINKVTELFASIASKRRGCPIALVFEDETGRQAVIFDVAVSANYIHASMINVAGALQKEIKNSSNS